MYVNINKERPVVNKHQLLPDKLYKSVRNPYEDSDYFTIIKDSKECIHLLNICTNTFTKLVDHTQSEHFVEIEYELNITE